MADGGEDVDLDWLARVVKSIGSGTDIAGLHERQLDTLHRLRACNEALQAVNNHSAAAYARLSRAYPQHTETLRSLKVELERAYARLLRIRERLTAHFPGVLGEDGKEAPGHEARHESSPAAGVPAPASADTAPAPADPWEGEAS